MRLTETDRCGPDKSSTTGCHKVSNRQTPISDLKSDKIKTLRKGQENIRAACKCRPFPLNKSIGIFIRHFARKALRVAVIFGELMELWYFLRVDLWDNEDHGAF